MGSPGPRCTATLASRDELLTELVIDAYHDLADALRAPRQASPAGLEPRPRFEAFAPRLPVLGALAQPHRYRLLYGPPLPGYDAHAQRLVDASQAAMSQWPPLCANSGTPPPPRPPSR